MIKKFFTLLCLCTLCIGSAWGETYTIDFYKGTSNGTNISSQLPSNFSTLCSSGDNYVSDFTGTNCYYSTTGCGIRLAKSGSAGSFSITFNSDIQNATVQKVIVYASAAASGNTLDVTPAGTVTEKTTFSNLKVFDMNNPSSANYKLSEISINGKLTSLTFGAASKKYVHLHKIDIVTGNAKTLTSISVSGTPTKTTYKEGESFDPAGMTVTGYYDDETNAPITSGIEWTITPSGALEVGTTSVSVTAKVGDITSSAYQVTGLTVTEYVQTYANTYTSNVTLTADGGTSASTAKVKWEEQEYDAIKAGTGKVAGACVVTIPEGTKTLHFHAAGWNGETVVLNESIHLAADGGVANNSPFTLQNDPETNDYFTLDPQGATTITFTATSGNRFVLFGVNAERTQDVTIAGTGYSSFSSTYAVTIPTGITAYYATAVEGTKVTMTEVEGGVIPANEGVIINGVASQTYTFTETVSDKSFEDNKLVAVSAAISGLAPEVTIDAVTYKNYVFTQGQFHPFTSGATVNVGAGKAYLQVEKPADPSAKLEMNFDGDTTGIDVIHNIQVNDNAIYNLRGERVNTMLKGNIYIVNGKKYLVK